MKNLRRAFALVLALALTFAMGITAMAAPSPTATVQSATALGSSAVTIPAGSTVKISAIVEVGASDASRTSLATELKALGTEIQKVFLMDVQATGSGAVTFFVGTQYAGKTVICEHYNTTTQKWEKIGTATVDANGNCTFTFTSFSPVALAISASAATTTSSSTSTTTATTSPKTGENSMIFVMELFALACIATAVVAGRKAKQL